VGEMMEGKIVNEKGHFLNEEQKKVKQKIMEDLLDTLFLNYDKNKELFTDFQSVTDLLFSVLVMFNREVLVHYITVAGISIKRKELMKTLFYEIKDQVDKRIKEGMN
jgi:hypothetical protein